MVKGKGKRVKAIIYGSRSTPRRHRAFKAPNFTLHPLHFTLC